VGRGTLRIALVVERFDPTGGGVESVAWTVGHHLAAAGDEVHVFARRATPTDAVTVHSLPVPAFWQPTRVLAFSRAATRATRELAPHVVHSFSRTLHQDVYRAGGGSHADYLERAHGARGARVRSLSPRHAVLLAIEARIFGDRSQWIQCNSEMVRDEIRNRHGVEDARLAVIVNGVDLERFSPRRRDAERERVRATLGTSPDVPVWLFVGSGFHRKGVDTALAALASSPNPAERWIAGADAPGPWRAEAERLGVAERTRFLGLRRDVAALYAAADALVLPTRYDAFANVCLEAAASGLPIVTSAANGAARWLGDAALVVEHAADAHGFSGALEALLEPTLRETLGQRARARAEGRSWERHTEELRALYAEVVR
jgi:UDP-glucose:(heptosyl)LPS alpha-1,3-glucosyltransferase